MIWLPSKVYMPSITKTLIPYYLVICSRPLLGNIITSGGRMLNSGYAVLWLIDVHIILQGQWSCFLEVWYRLGIYSVPLISRTKTCKLVTRNYDKVDHDHILIWLPSHVWMPSMMINVLIPHHDMRWIRPSGSLPEDYQKPTRSLPEAYQKPTRRLPEGLYWIL